MPTGTATNTPTPIKAAVYVDPATQAVPPGAVSVTIAATGVADLGSYSLTVAWDDAVLQLDSMSNGTLLGSTGLTVICTPAVVTSSSATLSCLTTGLLQGATGDGDLATLAFTSVADGKSPLTLTSISLLTTAALDIDIATTDGSVSVVTPTETPTLAPTDTPTATPTPFGSSATFYCTDGEPVTSNSGDNDGFELNPDNACALDGLLAHDTATGTNNNSSCSDPGKDRHDFEDFQSSISGGDTIHGIEVGLDVAGSTDTYVCAQLSWDGGNSWTAPKFTFSLSSTVTTVWLGSPTDDWGRTWSGGDLSNGNLVVRLTSVAVGPNETIRLDAVAVRITYSN